MKKNAQKKQLAEKSKGLKCKALKKDNPEWKLSLTELNYAGCLVNANTAQR